jgi:hypothetical protein
MRTVTVNIDNIVFTEYKRAAQLIRDALVTEGRKVPLNQLIDLLINAELARTTPEEIARHFVILLEIQESRVVADSGREEFLQEGENGGIQIAGQKPDNNIRPEKD